MKKPLILSIILLVMLGLAYPMYAGIGSHVKDVPATVTVDLVKCGDQNGDGEVDIQDAIIDLQITVKLIEADATQQYLSDLNQDGTVNVVDAILLLRQIVGLVATLDVCGPSTT